MGARRGGARVGGRLVPHPWKIKKNVCYSGGILLLFLHMDYGGLIATLFFFMGAFLLLFFSIMGAFCGLPPPLQKFLRASMIITTNHYILIYDVIKLYISNFERPIF